MPFQNLRAYPTLQVTKKRILRLCPKWQNHALHASQVIFCVWTNSDYEVIMWLLDYFCMSVKHSVEVWLIWWISSVWDLIEVLSVDTLFRPIRVVTKILANAVKLCFWNCAIQAAIEVFILKLIIDITKHLLPLMIFFLDLRKCKPWFLYIYIYI